MIIRLEGTVKELEVDRDYYKMLLNKVKNKSDEFTKKGILLMEESRKEEKLKRKLEVEATANSNKANIISQEFEDLWEKSKKENELIEIEKKNLVNKVKELSIEVG